jgi:hypothetical protein
MLYNAGSENFKLVLVFIQGWLFRVMIYLHFLVSYFFQKRVVIFYQIIMLPFKSVYNAGSSLD